MGVNTGGGKEERGRDGDALRIQGALHSKSTYSIHFKTSWQIECPKYLHSCWKRFLTKYYQ